MTVLSSSLQLKNILIPSRLWSAPAVLLACDDADHQVQSARRIAHGLTAVVMIPAAVSEDGQSHPGELLVGEKKGAQQLAELCAAVRSESALPLVELRHGGPRAGDYICSQPLGPPIRRTDPINKRETVATDADSLQQVIQAHVQTARLALEAGAALLSLEVRDGNFFQHWLTAAGHVDDVSFATRAQPLLQTVREIKACVNVEIPLCINLAMQDYKIPGLTIADTLQLAQWLVAAGADALLLSSGDRSSAPLSRLVRPPGPVLNGRYAAMASWCKARVDVPVGLLGGWRSQRAIDAALGDVLDFVVLERPYACEPDLGSAVLTADWHSLCTSNRDCLYSENVDRNLCPPACERVRSSAI